MMTIIVLIILAGVSINAVLNGGIITNAKDAKNEYNEGKVKEETALIDLEVQSDFETAAKNGEGTYKFQNKFMTGIEPETKVSDITLPYGYKLYKVDGTTITEEEAKSTNVSTGMMLKKNEKEIGRIVIYGEVDCNGEIDTLDCTEISKCVGNKAEYTNYQIAAMDTNHDGIINYIDTKAINRYLGQFENALNQNVYAIEPRIQTNAEIIEAYIASASDDVKERFVYSDEYQEYEFIGVTTGTKVEDLVAILPENTIITNALKGEIQDGSYITIKDEESGATLDVAYIVM